MANNKVVWGGIILLLAGVLVMSINNLSVDTNDLLTVLSVGAIIIGAIIIGVGASIQTNETTRQRR